MAQVLTKDTKQKTHLSLCRRGPGLALLQIQSRPQGRLSSFLSVPAMPKALLQLQLLLAQRSADLAAITTTIRNDLGLSLALLRLAASDIDGCEERLLPVSELIVLAGLQRIMGMAETCGAFSPDRMNHRRHAACERFWLHSQLTAHVAEELAAQASDISKEEAFFAGLFYQLAAMPLHLGWDMASSPTRDLGELVYELATEWNLPPVLTDVIRGHRDRCRSSKSRTLLDLAGAASTWAYRLEFLAARESETMRVSHPPYIHRVPLERKGQE